MCPSFLCCKGGCLAGREAEPGSQEAQIARLGKETDGVRQRVDHLQSSVDVLQEAAVQAKGETAGLRVDVVRLTEENTRLRSESDNVVQVRERALADATRLWQVVDRLGGDGPIRGSQGMGCGSPGMGSSCETQNVIPSSTSKG